MNPVARILFWLRHYWEKDNILNVNMKKSDDVEGFSQANLTGKRLLITHPIINNINGSTIVVLELAEFLKEQGAEVLVYTNYKNGPALDLFKNKGLEVTDDYDSYDYSVSHFDYVWINSQVVPPRIVKDLSESIPDIIPRFIFNHMSALDHAVDEHPYIWGLEVNISSLSLCVSKETKDYISDTFGLPLNFALYRNPVPRYYTEVEPRRSTYLSRVAIISNHPPPELFNLRDLLQRSGVFVTMYGDGLDVYSLITPEIISSFDLIVTIGKTVQYCLVAGTPVFIYDHFGGCGYLDEKNYISNAETNFSGRSFPIRRSAEILFNEINIGYSQCMEFFTRKRDDFIDEYIIDNVFYSAISNMKFKKISPIDKQLASSILGAQDFAARFYRYWGLVDELRADLARSFRWLGADSPTQGMAELILKKPNLNDSAYFNLYGKIFTWVNGKMVSLTSGGKIVVDGVVGGIWFVLSVERPCEIILVWNRGGWVDKITSNTDWTVLYCENNAGDNFTVSVKMENSTNLT